MSKFYELSGKQYIRVEGGEPGSCYGCVFAGKNECGCLPDCGMEHIYVEYVEDKQEQLDTKVKIPQWLSSLIGTSRDTFRETNFTRENTAVRNENAYVIGNVLSYYVARLQEEGISLTDLARAVEEGHDIKHESVKGYKHMVIEWTCPNCKTDSHDYDGDRFGICPSCLTEYELEY